LTDDTTTYKCQWVVTVNRQLNAGYITQVLSKMHSFSLTSANIAVSDI